MKIGWRENIQNPEGKKIQKKIYAFVSQNHRNVVNLKNKNDSNLNDQIQPQSTLRSWEKAALDRCI